MTARLIVGWMCSGAPGAGAEGEGGADCQGAGAAREDVGVQPPAPAQQEVSSQVLVKLPTSVLLLVSFFCLPASVQFFDLYVGPV
jgi:hypothetical protein